MRFQRWLLVSPKERTCRNKMTCAQFLTKMSSDSSIAGMIRPISNNKPKFSVKCVVYSKTSTSELLLLFMQTKCLPSASLFVYVSPQHIMIIRYLGEVASSHLNSFTLLRSFFGTCLLAGELLLST